MHGVAWWVFVWCSVLAYFIIGGGIAYTQRGLSWIKPGTAKQICTVAGWPILFGLIPLYKFYWFWLVVIYNSWEYATCCPDGELKAAMKQKRRVASAWWSENVGV